MGVRDYLPKWLGGVKRNAPVNRPLTPSTPPAPTAVQPESSREDDGLVYGTIAKVDGGRVVIRLDNPRAYAPTGKPRISFKSIVLDSGYDGVVVGVPREMVSGYCGTHYEEQLARIRAKRGGGVEQKAASGGDRLEGVDLAALAAGEVKSPVAQKPSK